MKFENWKTVAVVIAAMFVIGAVEIVAMTQGINGVALAGALVAIAGLAGVAGTKFYDNRKK